MSFQDIIWPIVFLYYERYQTCLLYVKMELCEYNTKTLLQHEDFIKLGQSVINVLLYIYANTYKSTSVKNKCTSVLAAMDLLSNRSDVYF